MKRGGTEEIRKEMEEVLKMFFGFKEEMGKILENVAGVSKKLDKIEENLKAFTVAKEKEKAEGMVLLLDFDNLFLQLSDLNLVFNPKTLLEELKQVLKRKIIKAKAFYGKFIHPFYRIALSQAGYEIVYCPSVAIKGKDTVDEQILNDAHFWARVDFVDTIVIVSGDKDMVLPINVLQEAGKNVVLVKLDKMSRVLMNKEGTIKLRLSSIPSSSELMDERAKLFLSYLEAIKDLNRLCPTESEFVFLLWVSSQLPQKATSQFWRGFENLVESLWTDAYITIYKASGGNIEKRDTARILHVLLNYTDILEKRKGYNPDTKSEETYYVFNPKSNLWPKVLRRIEELCNKQPEWNPYFSSIKV